jgi:hypothetical protein
MLREVSPEDLQALPDIPTQEDLDGLPIKEGTLDGFEDPLVVRNN